MAWPFWLQEELLCKLAPLDEITPNPHPEELALAERINHPGRRGQFLAARFLAHEAIQESGLNDGPILKGEGGEPLWPRGPRGHAAVGSLSHSERHAACALLRQESSYQFLGLDLEELDRNIRPQIQGKLFSAEECELHRLQEGEFGQRARILFGLKEAVFKALYPLVKEHFGFFEAQVGPFSKEGIPIELSQALIRKGAPERLEGFYRIQGASLLCLVLGKKEP